MADTLKLVTLNIEGDKHFDRIIPFLKTEDPDVICLQEVFAADIDYLVRATGMHQVFTPLTSIEHPNRANLATKGLMGLMILTKSEPISSFSEYYVGSADAIPVFIDSPPFNMTRAILSAKVRVGETDFTVATTHFTWSTGGEATEQQLKDADAMLAIATRLGQCVFCGDFNAPRGRETHRRIAAVFTDNVPPEVTTTLDPALHKVPGLQYVVDGLFTTDRYRAANVRVVAGVSDHQAIVGEVTALS